MRRVALLVLCVVLPAGTALADGRTSAMRTVEAYSSAVNQFDCSAMLRLMSPAVAKRLHDQPSCKAGFCKFTEVFRAASVREFLRAPIASLASGKYRMLVVPNTRMADLEEVGAPVLYEEHTSCIRPMADFLGTYWIWRD